MNGNKLQIIKYLLLVYLPCKYIKDKPQDKFSIQNINYIFYSTVQQRHEVTPYLGATDPFLHSDSNEGSTAGFRTAVRMIFRAIVQFCSCFSGNEEAKSPNAILLFDTAIAGSRKGSSISTRKRILCLTSWRDIK